MQFKRPCGRNEACTCLLSYTQKLRYPVTVSQDSGQEAFAVEKLKVSKDKIFTGFHKTVEIWLENKADIEEEITKLINADYEVITSDEVGLGIVPLDRKVREWREATGRALCRIAAEADEVYRVSCGIGMKIK